MLNLEHGIPKSIFFPTSVYMWYNLVGRAFVNSYGQDDHKVRWLRLRPYEMIFDDVA